MNVDGLSQLTHEGFRLLATLGAPLFGVLLGTGLTIGILQSASQINDSSVGFVPKLCAGLLTTALLGHWMVGRLAEFLVYAMQHLAAGG